MTTIKVALRGRKSTKAQAVKFFACGGERYAVVQHSDELIAVHFKTGLRLKGVRGETAAKCEQAAMRYLNGKDGFGVVRKVAIIEAQKGSRILNRVGK